jgi:hypothetical protein
MVKHLKFYVAAFVVFHLSIIYSGIAQHENAFVNIFFNIFDMLILYIISIFVFSQFDVIGYSEIVRKKYNLDKTALYIYRIIQTIVQWSIAIYVWQFYPYVAILYITSWWFGVCDHLYYILNDDERDWYFSNATAHMPWLWWTSFGILDKNLMNNKVSQSVANWTMSISLLSIPIVYFLFYFNYNSFF